MSIVIARFACDESSEIGIDPLIVHRGSMDSYGGWECVDEQMKYNGI